jgi:hypothetical protein
MATDRQIAANRLNAQKSTGPKTPEGRATVRLNSLTHGLTAKTLVLPGESEEDFEELERLRTQRPEPQEPQEQEAEIGSAFHSIPPEPEPEPFQPPLPNEPSINGPHVINNPNAT